MTSAITLSRVAALCLLAGAAHASPVPVSTAADASVPVPPTRYTPAAQYRPAVPDAASPDRAWREQNRIVAAQNSMMLTMGGQAQGADPHAGHAGHAGHAADAHAAMPMGDAAPAQCSAGSASAPAGAKSGASAPSCCADAGCCKDGAGMGGCCGKDAAGAQSGGHQHGAQP
jgi:hypothetical protein